jgi:hypothetical protein
VFHGNLDVARDNLLKSAKPNQSMDVASHYPLVLVDRNFLALEECKAIIDLARQEGRTFGTSSSNRDTKYEMTAWPEQESLLESVYERVDAICGPSRSSDETMPKVHFYGPDPSNGPRMPSGLHVDTNARPYRYVTAIIYLSTVPPAGDGATVFPCANNSKSATASESTPLSASADELLREQVLHTNLANLDTSTQRHADVLLQAAETEKGSTFST